VGRAFFVVESFFLPINSTVVVYYKEGLGLTIPGPVGRIA